MVPLPAVAKVTVTGDAEAALRVITFCVAVPSATVTGVVMAITGAAVLSVIVPVPVAVPIVAPLPLTLPMVAVKVSVGSPGNASAIVGTLKLAVN